VRVVALPPRRSRPETLLTERTSLALAQLTKCATTGNADVTGYLMQVAATPAAEEAPAAPAAAATDVLTPAEREEHTLVGRALELRYLADPTHNKALAAAVHELLRLNGALHAHEPTRHTRTQGLARFAAVVRGAEGPITSRQAVRELRLPFLGGLGSEDSQCLQFLDQFLQSGRIRRLEEHRGDAALVAKALFLKLPGAGPHAALQWAQDGHRSLADVQRAALDGSLTGLAELSDLGRAAVACGSALLEPLGMREFEALHTAVKDAARKVDPALACELTGGYSRRAPGGGPDSSYHDVDVLIKYDDCARYAGGADTALSLLLAHLRRAPGLAVLAEQIAGVDGNGLQAMRKEWAHICDNTPVGAANIDQYRKARSALRLQRSSSSGKCAEAALAASGAMFAGLPAPAAGRHAAAPRRHRVCADQPVRVRNTGLDRLAPVRALDPPLCACGLALRCAARIAWLHTAAPAPRSHTHADAAMCAAAGQGAEAVAAADQSLHLCGQPLRATGRRVRALAQRHARAAAGRRAHGQVHRGRRRGRLHRNGGGCFCSDQTCVAPGT
jgi:hypothetical protein